MVAYESPSATTGDGSDVLFGDGRVDDLGAGPTAALVRGGRHDAAVRVTIPLPGGRRRRDLQFR